MYIYTVCVVYLFSTIIFQPVVRNRYKYCYQYECVNLSKVGQVEKHNVTMEEVEAMADAAMSS